MTFGSRMYRSCRTPRRSRSSRPCDARPRRSTLGRASRTIERRTAPAGKPGADHSPRSGKLGMAYAQYPGVKHEFAELARAKAGDAQAVVANALEGGAEAIRAGVTRGPGVALAKRASSHLRGRRLPTARRRSSGGPGGSGREDSGNAGARRRSGTRHRRRGWRRTRPAASVEALAAIVRGGSGLPPPGLVPCEWRMDGNRDRTD